MFRKYGGRAARWLANKTNIVGTSPAHIDLRNRLSAIESNLNSKIAAVESNLNSKIAALEAQLALSDRHQTLGFWTALDRVYDHILIDRTLSCIICGHSAKRDGFEHVTSKCIFGGGKLERYKCPTCECIFGAQKFLDQPEEMVDLDYQLLYSRYKEGNTTNIEIDAFRSTNPRRGEAYVNWGCGAWNSTVAALRLEGWDVWGYEPSAARTSEHVVSQKEDLPTKISGIFSNNVIEHFLDPVAQFNEFNALLPTGARMAHSTACYEYLYEFTRFHTVFLTGRSPQVLAERTGFRVVDRTQQGEHINVVFEKI